MTLHRRTFMHGVLSVPVGALLSHTSLSELHATVRNGADLRKALQAARPGDTIVLAPGDYGDVSEFEVATPELTIRAAVPLRSVLRVPLIVSGEGTKLYDLSFIDEEADGIVMAALTACSDSVSIIAPNVEVARCNFGYFRARGILVRPSGLRPYIHDCSFHDNRAGSGSQNAHEAISLGYSNANSGVSMRARVVNNLMWNLNVEGEAITVKASDNVIEGNRLSNSRAAYSNRCGERNVFKNNASTNSGGFAIEDRGSQLVGNVISGNGLIKILAGNATADNRQTAANLHRRATDTYLDANQGALVVGYTYSGATLPAINTTVKRHVGHVSLRDQTGTKLL